MEEEVGGDEGVDYPDDGDGERGDECRAVHKLVDADAQGHHEQDEAEHRHPEIAHYAVRQLAHALDRRLECDLVACMGATEGFRMTNFAHVLLVV